MQLAQDSKVVVFGGAGYIGSVLVPMLIEANFKVKVFDNMLFGDSGLKRIKSKNLEIIEADICDTRSVSSAINGADAVILLAAIIGHRAKDNDCKDTRTVNFLASTSVLDAAIEHGVSRFIFSSTNSIYGLQNGLMYETSIPEPVSLYSRLKLRLEERIINARNRSFHPTALRIATCHGASPRMRFDLVLNGMVRDAYCKKEITIDSPEKVRSLIHVNDVARAILSCLSAHQNMISGEIFNLGNSDQNLQLNQLANIVKTHLPETKVTMLDEEPDLTSYRLSCAKIEKLVGFKSEIDIEQSVKETIELLKNLEHDPYSLRFNNT